MSNAINFQKNIETLISLGVNSAARLSNSYHTSDYEGGMILSHDPERSHIPPKFVTITDVDMMKNLCGVADETAKATGVIHPIPPAVHEVGYSVSSPTDPHVCQAMSAYIHGNSELVSSWKPTLNRLRFPIQAAVFTGGSITIDPGHPLRLEGTEAKPFAGLFNVVTIDNGGQIITKGPGTVSVDEMKMALPIQDNNVLLSVGDNVTTLVALGGDGGNGGDGGDGANAKGGSTGAAATSKDKSSCNLAGAGGPGGDGTDATKGGDGGDGGNALPVTYNVTTMNGNYLVGSVGGNGGDGGIGGKGGDGGDGGPGGAAYTGHTDSTCAAGAQGKGGNGGKAGDGGKGGNGGNGDKVYINYTSGAPIINMTTQKANGGNGGGIKGTGGQAGTGNPNGTGGGSGTPGTGGTGGNPGSVIINGAQ